MEYLLTRVIGPRHTQLYFSMSTEDGASTKRHKAHAMLGQLREGDGGDGGEGGGTAGWEEVRLPYHYRSLN